jgi:hypothetical protein
MDRFDGVVYTGPWIRLTGLAVLSAEDPSMRYPVHRTPAIWLCALTCAFLCPGCIMFVYGAYDAGVWREIRPAEPDWGGYEPDAVYELQQAVFLADFKYYSYGPALAPGKGVEPIKRDPEWGGPTTPEAYKQDPGKWPEMDDTVDAGTRLRVTRMRKKTYALGDVESHIVFAEIIDGPHEGETVEITELSVHLDCESWRLMPNQAILKPVEEHP